MANRLIGEINNIKNNLSSCTSCLYFILHDIYCTIQSFDKYGTTDDEYLKDYNSGKLKKSTTPKFDYYLNKCLYNIIKDFEKCIIEEYSLSLLVEVAEKAYHVIDNIILYIDNYKKLQFVENIIQKKPDIDNYRLSEHITGYLLLKLSLYVIDHEENKRYMWVDGFKLYEQYRERNTLSPMNVYMNFVYGNESDDKYNEIEDKIEDIIRELI